MGKHKVTATFSRMFKPTGTPVESMLKDQYVDYFKTETGFGPKKAADVISQYFQENPKASKTHPDKRAVLIRMIVNKFFDATSAQLSDLSTDAIPKTSLKT